MRKKLWFLAGGVGILAVASYASGFATSYIGNAPAMLSGMGAMVSCSQHFVSGIDKEQAQRDLETYSPLFGTVDIQYEDTTKRVTASVLDIAVISAQYREGQGCALEIGDTSALDEVQLAVRSERNAEWPLGDTVETIDAKVQRHLECDNESR